MYDTPERVQRAKSAARRLMRKQERRTLRRLGALCAALALALAGVLTRLTGDISGAVQGMHGATLLADSAGGYVLVGVAAFTIAAALTVACMRLHQRDKQNGDQRRKEMKPPPADQ